MPAAPRQGRRGLPETRTKGPASPSRQRPARVPPRGVSKIGAAKGAGLPRAVAMLGIGMLMALAGAAILATGDRAPRLVAAGRNALDSRFASLGLDLQTVHLQGASPAAQREILEAAALRHGAPILTMDLDVVRRRVEKVAWVKSARVIRLWPDTLVIAIEQRPLMAVWEHAGRTAVVAADGTVVSQADPSRYSALPLIVGGGANTAVAGILPAIYARPRLAGLLEALVRVDQRRWDLRLKDGGLIQLPADGEAAALNRLDTLDAKSRVLELGLARIDLRDPAMVVVRPRESAGSVLASGGV